MTRWGEASTAYRRGRIDGMTTMFGIIGFVALLLFWVAGLL